MIRPCALRLQSVRLTLEPRFGVMLRALAYLAPTASRSRSNVASHPRSERRASPPTPETPTGLPFPEVSLTCKRAGLTLPQREGGNVAQQCTGPKHSCPGINHLVRTTVSQSSCTQRRPKPLHSAIDKPLPHVRWHTTGQPDRIASEKAGDRWWHLRQPGHEAQVHPSSDHRCRPGRIPG